MFQYSVLFYYFGYLNIAIKQSYSKSMLKQTLKQIDHLSIQMQQNIKKALQLQQSQKQSQPSPATHHNSHNNKYQSTQANRRGHQKSSSQPHPEATNKELSHSHIRPFMIESENQLLKAQLEEMKNKNREYRQEIREMKRYVQFLQQYNDNLKKEVVLWMTRPAKKPEYSNELGRNASELRARLSDIIMGKSTKDNYISTNNNSMVINSSIDDKYHKGIQQQLNNAKIKYRNNPESQSLSPRSHSSSSSQQHQQHQTKAKKSKVSGMKQRKQQGECTSCNYLQYKKNKSLFFDQMTPNHTHFIHRHHLTQGKQIKNDVEVNGFSAGLHGYVDNRKVGLPARSSKKGNKQGNCGLCECHGRFVKEGKF